MRNTAASRHKTVGRVWCSRNLGTRQNLSRILTQSWHLSRGRNWDTLQIPSTDLLVCPGHPTQSDMADGYLHEDRSRVRTSSVAAAIQSLQIVSRKSQVEQLLAILDTPLIEGYLASSAIPRPRREDGSATDLRQNTKTFSLAAFYSCMGRPPLRKRAAHMSLFTASRQTCHNGESAGGPKLPDLANHLVLLLLVFLVDLQAGVATTCTTTCFAIGTHRWWT